MRDHSEWKKFFVATAAIAALSVPVVTLALTARLQAQAPATQPPTPQWQIDAGGKMAFDVASVKPDKSDAPANSNFPLGPGDGYAPNGGLFAASNQPLIDYITFAYKLRQGDLAG